MHHHKSIIQNIQPYTVVVSLFVALVATWVADWLRRKPTKTNIKFIKAKTFPQVEESLVMGRLVGKNYSNKKAVSVEAYIEAIEDNGVPRKDFLPVPLHWTHYQLNEELILKNICGNQYFYLDIFNFHTVFKYLKLCTPITGIGNYTNLKEGLTELTVRIYQASGQEFSKKIIIEWEKEKLPTIKIQ